MSKTVLLSAPYMLPEVERFRPVFERYNLALTIPPVDERLSEAELLVHAGQFDGVICGDDHFTASVLEACAPRLKVISKWGTGIDTIDQTAAAKLGIQICNTPNAFTQPVADTVMGYILAFARRQPWMDAEMKTSQWQKLPGRSLSECTLGVIGVGNVGMAVLQRAKAFGMRLLGTDIVEIPAKFIVDVGVEMVALEDLLSQSDFVSLNCDLNDSSRHLINQRMLELMIPEAVLINTARGGVVNESALIAALEAKGIAGAALDVFELEPLPADSALLNMQNVLLAPHNANSSPSAWEHVHWNSIRNLLEGLGIPADDLNPEDYA